MSKKALFLLPISLIVISTASCSWLLGTRDYVSEQNPTCLIEKRYKNASDSHYIRYNGYDLKGKIVNKIIDEVGNNAEYTYVKDTPTLKGKSFDLVLEYPSFWVASYRTVCFYENGYATTSRYDSKKEKHYTYYYQFDEELAIKVCNLVDDEYTSVKEAERREQEERDNVGREYNQMIEDMTIYTVIDKMSEEENVDLEFFFVTDEEERRYYDFTFKDDGSIYAALKGAEYSEYVAPDTNWDTVSLAYLTIKGRRWNIKIDKAAKCVTSDCEIVDKYNRHYSKSFELSIDDDSLNTVMNLAYELSAPKNPFSNDSSNPSSSSEEHA